MKNVLFSVILTVMLVAALVGCNSTGDAVYGEQDSLPQTHTETTAELLEEETSTDPSPETTSAQYLYGEWYLSEWDVYPVLPNKEIDEKYQNVCIRLPLVYEENVDGVNIKAEFFVETYRVPSFIQLRLTYTNTTDQRIIFDVIGSSGCFWGDNFNLAPLISKYNKSFVVDSVHLVPLDPGSDYMDEIIYYFGPFFDPEETYTFRVGIMDYSNEQRKIFATNIPIEIYKDEG